jgi:hypothetical protein
VNCPSGTAIVSPHVLQLIYDYRKNKSHDETC